MSVFTVLALVAALGLLILGRRFLDPRPRLLIDERGIRHRGLQLGWIRWDEIEGAYPPTLDDGEALRLKLRLTERLKRRLRDRRSGAGRTDRGCATVEIRIDLAGAEIGPLELLEEILRRTAGGSHAATTHPPARPA